MAHKTLIGGTAYEIAGGKTLVNGAVYTIESGKTLVNGTVYGIDFQEMITLRINPNFDFWNDYTGENASAMDTRCFVFIGIKATDPNGNLVLNFGCKRNNLHDSYGNLSTVEADYETVMVSETVDVTFKIPKGSTIELDGVKFRMANASGAGYVYFNNEQILATDKGGDVIDYAVPTALTADTVITVPNVITSWGIYITMEG